MTQPTNLTERRLECANCRIGLRSEVIWRDEQPFCCDGCAEKGPCSC